MRNAFADEITKLASEDERVVLLSGDIGNRLFNSFKDVCPDRFYNCGVAEANMASVAAGMALCGMRPVTYTITAFNTLRCVEHIRLDISYQQLPVVIVGVGGGLSYASLNASHHALEDIAYLRCMPGMTVVCPADAWETRAAIRAAMAINTPIYIRLGKKNEPTVHDDVPDFKIGRAMQLEEGKDVCLIGTGVILPNCLAAARMLHEKGISAAVVNMHTVKPLDEGTLQHVFSDYSLVVTIEEHGIAGGLGGAVAEWLSANPAHRSRLLRLGTSDVFMYEAGEQEHARNFFGLGEDQICQSVLDAYESGA